MKCYLELGSITTSFFSRPVPYSVWDEKVAWTSINCALHPVFITLREEIFAARNYRGINFCEFGLIKLKLASSKNIFPKI